LQWLSHNFWHFIAKNLSADSVKFDETIKVCPTPLPLLGKIGNCSAPYYAILLFILNGNGKPKRQLLSLNVSHLE